MISCTIDTVPVGSHQITIRTMRKPCDQLIVWFSNQSCLQLFYKIFMYVPQTHNLTNAGSTTALCKTTTRNCLFSTFNTITPHINIPTPMTIRRWNALIGQRIAQSSTNQNSQNGWSRNSRQFNILVSFTIVPHPQYTTIFRC